MGGRDVQEQQPTRAQEPADVAPAPGESRFRSLWNIGCKATDVRAESEDLQRLGARLRLHETLPGAAGPVEYAILEFGGTRVLFTPDPVFSGAVNHELHPGLTHAVFEVNDHDAACAAALAAGARQLTAARVFEAGFGKRRAAFFQSPGGLVFEALKIIEARI
jgi:catechol 2,3-dioxygenase-like lactoylglutathione lyase family enzyme